MTRGLIVPRLLLALMLFVLCLAGEHAVAGGRWVKDGATQEEITRDDIACFKESQRQVNVPRPEGRGQPGIQSERSTGVRGSRSYGSSETQPKTEPDVDLYRACAYARGYVWVKS